MANIDAKLEQILTTIYGEEMRRHIHDVMQTVNNDLNGFKNTKAKANGLASLGSDGKIPDEQLPDLSITEVSVVNSQSAMLALNAQQGDFAIRTDVNQLFVLKTGKANVLSNWHNFGIIVLKKSDIGLGNVDNTADADKNVLSATKLTTPRKISGVEFDGTKDITLTKESIGLNKVDNTADADKNVLSATKLTTPRKINNVSFDGTKDITITDDTKEPKINNGTSKQYIAGDKKLANFDMAVINAVLSEFEVEEAGVPITEEDSVLTAFAKLQAQINEIKESDTDAGNIDALNELLIGCTEELHEIYKKIGISHYDGGIFESDYGDEILDGGSFDEESEESFDCGEFDETSE